MKATNRFDDPVFLGNFEIRVFFILNTQIRFLIKM